MKQKILTLLLSAICAGCAQQPTMPVPAYKDSATGFNESHLSSDTLKPPLQGQVVVLNPDGGKFFTLKQTFSETGRFDIRLVIEQSHPHARWLPGATLCLVEKASLQDRCLRFSSWEQNRPRIQVQMLVIDNGKLAKTTALPGVYRYGEAIAIRMRKTDRGAELIYGSQPPIMIPTISDVEMLEISCSSALCSLRVDET